MPRSELDEHFRRIEHLVNEFNAFAPSTNITNADFRADLAGLLVVTIAASYESCVKSTLVSYAALHHSEFENFAINNYSRLNSRININDLNNYTRIFGQKIETRFNKLYKERKSKILHRVGKNIESSYKSILSWRHDFAHAGSRNTTIEEAFSTHKIAKRVLYTFDDAFHKPA